jgi:hypothetical protein
MDSIDQQPIPSPARLQTAPPTLIPTRLALHALAAQTISPARQAVTGKIGLRATPGGFGTPAFGDLQDVLRVEGTELVAETDGTTRDRAPIPGADGAAAAFLADWYAFGAAVLIALRDRAGEGAEPSLIQLWPEHFDIAVELGATAEGGRATYGFSPGDDEHPEPYAYVSAWTEPAPGPLWNATAFKGAELPYAELADALDPQAVALAFMTERLTALTRA